VRVIPTFRPDALLRIASSGWRDELQSLAAVNGNPITGLSQFLGALSTRRAHFIALGATATDHAVLEPYTQQLPPGEAERLFGRAMTGEATHANQRDFEGHMLLEMARMSVDDGLVMQLHAGAFRDHNSEVFAAFGTDKGADIPVATEFTQNLRPLLERYGNDTRFSIVLFTLDESTYAAELAPLAGHYPAVRLGPPWWFHDSIEGMKRYRQRTTETASIYKTAGFNDDTRAFCSIPARHDLSRRVDANFLAGLVARHVIDLGDARVMARALAYELARETYRMSATTPQPTGATR
jgi:glucuronate isomerase